MLVASEKRKDTIKLISYSPYFGLVTNAPLLLRCCTVAAQGFSDLSGLRFILQNIPAKRGVLRVGDAGFEPATSAV